MAVDGTETAPATVHGLVLRAARTRPTDTAVTYLDESGAWTPLSYRELAGAVERERRNLLDRGVRVGDRVAVLADTGPSWIVADLAVLSAGAVTVPVYPTSSAAQVAHILAETGAVFAYGETEDHRELLRCGAGSGAMGVRGLPSDLHSAGDAAGDVLAVGTETGDVVVGDALATIVYTSGTTGSPKGCMLTHRNLLSGVDGVVRATECVFIDDERPTSTLVCLPLAHIYARTTVLGALATGTRAGLLRHPSQLTDVIGGFGPTFLALTPHLLAKVADLAVSAPDGRAALGGRLRHVICGGAPVDPSLAATLSAAGVTVLAAYGMTETASAAAINRPSDNRPGTVGRAIPGTTITISDDGEILVSGENASPGYWDGTVADSYPCSANRVVPTGDLGSIDDDGFLVITGRRKELLVTSSGKNVSPGPIEEKVRAHPLVSQCVVVGDGRPYIAALVTLSAAELQRRNVSPDEASADSGVVREIQTAVDLANEFVSRAESIRRFRILPADFTLEKGQLTASMKLRRDTITADHAEAIDALYAARRA